MEPDCDILSDHCDNPSRTDRVHGIFGGTRRNLAMTRTEQQTKKDIIDRLNLDKRIDSTDIGVLVNGQRVILRGTVSNDLAREIAAKDAQEVAAVATIDNQLCVRPPLSRSVPMDDELKRRVQVALGKRPGVSISQPQVTVENGTVTVRGSVDSLWQKAQAEEACDKVPGVKAVVNQLAVAPSDLRSDEALSKEITDALARNDSANAELVGVHVESGRVILSGIVPTEFARQIAYNTAFHTPGVKEVRDELVVSW
jgi:osmotically-inducible protein OsmY